MDIAQSIKQFFLSISSFLNLVWRRVLPSHSSNRSPAFELESQSLEAPAQLPPQTINQVSPAIDIESQLPESQALPSLTIYRQGLSRTQETQPLNFTATSTEILSQTAHSQAPQPHSAMETEQQSPPPAQQTPPPAINPQQKNMVIVRQISLQWPNVVLEFCLQAAIQIALQYETTQHPKLPVSFYLRSFFILLTFTSLFVSHLIRNKSPGISRVLEKAATFLAATVFFSTIATPFTLARK